MRTAAGRRGINLTLRFAAVMLEMLIEIERKISIA
jgi:hypothetical protein